MNTNNLIDGKAFAERVTGQVREAVAHLHEHHGLVPGLAVVLVGEDPASSVYVRSKVKRSTECGLHSFEHCLSASASSTAVLDKVNELNKNPDVHGILVQLPLPQGLDSGDVIAAIDPAKDVDGFHVMNAGQLATGTGRPLVACTPLGCLWLLRDQLGQLEGLHAVIIGRSNIVGKPMAHLLLAENCTVTLAHSRTRNLADLVRSADIVVAAVGRPCFVQADWIKKGATVIDVGINRVVEDGRPRLVGDVDFAEARHVAGAITPVPGGVGPMTIATLLANTVRAACLQSAVDIPDCLPQL